MNRAAILKRVEALEGRKRETHKPVDLSRFFAQLAVLFVAKRRKGHESMLVAYARACRYRNVEALFEAAYHNPDNFGRKHVKATAYPSPHTRQGKPCADIVPGRDEVRAARRVILEEFLKEEIVARGFDAMEAAGMKLVGPSPLADVRPMRELLVV
jgi:antitoxin (DNA-binding transcriptional repressor) of toxin-antitoxin stability system